MNTQKEVTITELKAKFTKDHQNTNKFFFLDFIVGKSISKTQVGTPNNGNNKQPIWKDSIILTYFDQIYITVKVYDDQTNQRQCLGSGKIQIKLLRFPGGNFQVNFVTENGQNLGSLTGKYTIKNLTQNPLLLFKNMRVEFIKQSKQFNKSRPYLHFSNEEGSTSTEAKEQINGLILTWGELLRLRIKQSSKISICLIDKENNNGNYIFKYETSAKEFRLQSGTKKFNVLNKEYNHVATVQFDYQTLNFVSKEESVKGTERQRKQQGQLMSIHLQKISRSLKEGGIDIYYRFIVGINSLKTTVFQKAEKGDFSFPFKNTLLCEPKQNKMIILLLKKDIIGDKILGVGIIDLESLHNGQRKAQLKNQDTKQIVGSVQFACSITQLSCRILNIDNITASVAQDATLVGQIQPFVVINIGSSSAHTETAHQNKVTFKKAIELKFCEEQTFQLQIWDQDVAKNELLYSQKVKIKDLNNKGDHQISLVRKEQGKPQSKAKITFRYQIKSQTGTLDSPRKQTQKNQHFKTTKQYNAETERPKEQQKKLTQQDIEKSKFQSSRLTKNKSKGTVALPAIMASKGAFGDHIFDKQSAATLQKSIVAFSMPKANRFGYDAKYSGEPSYCIDSCFKPNPTKGVGFGFGGKKQFPDWMQRNMKENPPPGAYLQTSNDARPKGPTFGIGHKYYEKVFIPREKRSISGLTGRKLQPINLQKK